MVALNMKLAFVALMIMASLALVANGVFAKNDKGDTRPGWGYGDKNHVHTGPPGQSVRP